MTTIRSITCPVLCVSVLVALAASGCGDNKSPARPGDDGPASDSDGDSDPAVTFRVATPPTTPDDAHVYIAGDFQGWEPGHPDYELARGDDGVYQITLSFAAETTIQFKFTRGDWGRVEKDADGAEIANRTLTVSELGTHEFAVANWADLSTAPSTITGDVTTITVPGFLDDRRVWIYRPPNYDQQTEQRYPVLYMFDGQNIFDGATSFAGEWQVDETLEELIPAGQVAPIIVVAMDHGSDERIAEYTPWPDPEYKGGGGDEHLQAITDILIPYIDSNYRTLTGPDNTGLAGSSLGGLMALYAGYAQSPTFGRVAGLSPSLWWDGEHLVRHIDKLARPAGLVVYTDMGTLESGTTEDEDKNGIDDDIDRLRRLRDTLLAQGFVLGQNLLITEDEGASHNEAAWRARFPDAVRFLFPPR